MPWFKSDDGFPEHPKSDALAEHFGADWPTLNLAFATWHHMGCDCASRGTDGAFSSARAYRVMRAPREAIDAAVAGLLAVGLLEASEGAFVFHDWHHYQPSNVEVAAKREEVSRKRAEAGRKGGRKSGEARAGSKQNEANGKQTGSKPAKQNEANGQANDEAKLAANALPVGDRSKTEASGQSNDEAPSRPVPSRPVDTTPIPSPAPSAATPLPSQPTSPASATTPPALPIDLGDPTPPKAKPAPRKASAPKPAKPPPPFNIGAAFEALATASDGRFAPGIERDWTDGIRIAVAKRIRQYPDLAEWRLVGSWLLAGGDGYRESLGPSWAASNGLPDAMARAREWKAKGGDVIAARFTPAAPPDPADAVWAAAARKVGVAL